MINVTTIQIDNDSGKRGPGLHIQLPPLNQSQ